MYSTELGRLPVYGQFSFSDSRAYPTSTSFNANVDYTAFDVPVPGFTATQTFHNEPLEWNAQTFHQGSTENGGIDTMPMDSDAMTMWSTAPAGFELNEWGTYITSVNQMTYGQNFDNESLL